VRSLFGSLQNKFKATYEGRFFSIILADVLQVEPEAIFSVFPNLERHYASEVRRGEATITTEYHLRNGQRRADLAILLGGQPVALAEVKQADIRGHSVTGQLVDYRTEVRRARNAVCFSLVSEFEPYDEHKRIIEQSWGKGHSKVVRFHALAAALEKRGDRPAVKLLLDYMKEQRMTGYTPLPKKSDRDLKLLMTKLLPLRHAHGLGKLLNNDSIQGIPQLLGTLLRNVQHMEDWLRVANEEIFPRVFTCNLEVYPEYDKKALADQLRKAEDEDDQYLAGKPCTGGYLCVYAQATIRSKAMKAKKGHGIWLWLGYCLELDLIKASLGQYVCAGVSAHKSLFLDDEGQIDNYIKCAFSSSADITRTRLREVFNATRRQAIKASTDPAVSKFLKQIDLSGF